MINDRSPSISAVSAPAALSVVVSPPAVLLRLLRLIPTWVAVCCLLAPTSVSAATSLTPAASISGLSWLLLSPTPASSTALSSPSASVSWLCWLCWLSPACVICGRLLFSIAPSSVVRYPSTTSASAPFSNIRIISETIICAESIGTQIVP